MASRWGAVAAEILSGLLDLDGFAGRGVPHDLNEALLAVLGFRDDG